MTELAAESISPKAVIAMTPARGQLLRSIGRRKSLVVGLIGLMLIIVVAASAPLIAPHDPLKQDLTRSLAPPFWAEGGTFEHPLGTDTLGRDVASRLIFGARNSLFVALFAVLLAALLGLGAGLVAGFSRGWLDTVIMRLGDMQLAFPFILLAIVVLGVIPERNALHLILVIGFPGCIIYARVERSRVLSERDKEYMMAARSIGAGRLRLMWKYLLPSIWMAVLVIALLDFGFVILVEATLSFLGFGFTPPTPSWGSILAEGRRNMIIAPWLSILPGLAIMLTLLSINLVADGAADLLDPKLKKGIFRRMSQGPPHGPAPDRLICKPAAGPSDARSEQPLLAVRDLSITFPLEDRVIQAVRHVNFEAERGQTLGIVGESGSGKSVTASAIIQLIDPPGQITSGSILFEGQDLTQISNAEMSQLRGRQIGMIFQNPAASFNPVLSIGSQMVETIRQHQRVSPAEARDMASDALLKLSIGDPQSVLSQYPFQLSGGMNQRVMIALAMLARPKLLITDEPTTALDVTTQAQVLEQLRDLTREQLMAMILITHDIALIRQYADTIVVLYAGQVCERGPVEEVIQSPAHPYTQALLDSAPHADLKPGDRIQAIPGELPDPAEIPPGCPFTPRCRYAMEICSELNPPLEPVAPDRMAACHLETIPVPSEGAS